MSKNINKIYFFPEIGVSTLLWIRDEETEGRFNQYGPLEGDKVSFLNLNKTLLIQIEALSSYYQSSVNLEDPKSSCQWSAKQAIGFEILMDELYLKLVEECAIENLVFIKGTGN